MKTEDDLQERLERFLTQRSCDQGMEGKPRSVELERSTEGFSQVT